MINNKYINFSLSLSLSKRKKCKQVHFSRGTILRSVTKESRVADISITNRHVRARKGDGKFVLTKPSDKPGEEFYPMHELLGWRCTRLQAFIVEMSFSRELCRDTCARNLPARKFRSKNGFARGEMRAMTRSPCPSSLPPSLHGRITYREFLPFSLLLHSFFFFFLSPFFH